MRHEIKAESINMSMESVKQAFVPIAEL
jgi:hypothetical protein